MSLTLMELEQVVSEIGKEISGGIIQKIVQPDPDSIILSVRITGKTKKIFIRAREHFSRIHFLKSEPYMGDTMGRPLGLSPFTAKLRKEIEGLRIEKVRTMFDDRIVVIDFFRRFEEPKYRLIFECSGHHPNVFLTDYGNKIIATLKHSKSFKRDLIVGNVYQKPLPHHEPIVSSSRFIDQSQSISLQIQALYDSIERQNTIELRFQNLKRKLFRLIEHEKRKLEKISNDLNKASECENLKETAEILKNNINKIPACANEFIHNGIKISLDPLMKPSEFMKCLFKKYKKLKKALPFINKRLDDCKKNLTLIQNLKNNLENSKPKVEIIENMEKKLKELNLLSDKKGFEKEKVSERKPFREFLSRDGSKILVGREGKDNDYLTFRIARGNDLFFHATNRAGAHVILCAEKDKFTSHEAIYDAALLAGYFSKARNEKKVEVTYTQCKYVKRPRIRSRNQTYKPGRVMIEQSKTIMVNMEDRLLNRFLDRK